MTVTGVGSVQHLRRVSTDVVSSDCSGQCGCRGSLVMVMTGMMVVGVMMVVTALF